MSVFVGIANEQHNDHPLAWPQDTDVMVELMRTKKITKQYTIVPQSKSTSQQRKDQDVTIF